MAVGFSVMLGVSGGLDEEDRCVVVAGLCYV